MSTPLETAEQVGEYKPAHLPTIHDVDRTTLVRHVRGAIHLERMRLDRLVGAADGKPNIHQARSIATQRRLINEMLKRATAEGIDIPPYPRDNT